MFARGKKRSGELTAHIQPRPVEPPTDRLPKGAEAAIWSITEVIPDPRNHLALTRDPTCEIRLTASEIAAASLAAEPAVASIDAPVDVILDLRDPTSAPVPAPAAQCQLPRRVDVRWSEDTADVRVPTPTNVWPDRPPFARGA